MKSCRNKSCDMCHIDHKYCINFICDLTELLEIDRAGISRCSGDDHLRLALQSDLSYLIIIDKSLFINSVRNYVKICSGEINR